LHLDQPRFILVNLDALTNVRVIFQLVKSQQIVKQIDILHFSTAGEMDHLRLHFFVFVLR